MLSVSVMVGALLVATMAGVAWARTFTCDPGSTEQNPCEGTRRADTIFGTDGSDYILAKRGNDVVRAFGGNDEIHGGDGADTISGRSGNDDLYGEGGEDLIRGGSGNDAIDTVDGEGDQVWCGAGDDDFALVDDIDQINDDGCERGGFIPTNPPR